MADFRALSAVSDAVIEQLRTSAAEDDFGNHLEFRTFTSRDFANAPITNGISLFIYRIFCNGVRRTPPGRIGLDGRRMPTQLPVESHFLLTVWGGEASLQHALAGWMMRTMEDIALLPASVLNSVAPGSFRTDETVELVLGEMRTEDLLHLYEVLMPNVYQLSIPYVARVIHLESIRLLPAAAADVLERVQRVGVLDQPDAST